MEAQQNVRVEQVVRGEVEEANAIEKDAAAYEEIAAAVEAQMELRIAKMEEKAELSIKEAVKRVLERHNRSVAPKRKKRDPEFKSKGHQKRHEVNEDVIEKIDAAMKAIVYSL